MEYNWIELTLFKFKIKSSMRKFTLLLCMLVLSVLAFAQRTVTGTVRDDKGEIIPFATVSEVGKKNSVRADANGVFSIKAADGAKLQITSSGHQDQTVTVSGATLSAVLATRNEQLSEVVVTTALGQQRQAKELGYSTAKVRAAELTQAKPINLQNGLTGKVSGLNIQTVNNGVFADTRITLRGIRSLTGNNQPMLVLDGVPISLGYLNSINPNDIQDVTILKSASATAVYGPDGVNGAIVVTTRRGSKANPLVTISHTTQLETVSFMPKFQNQFGSGSSVDANGYGVYDPIENQTYGDAFDGSVRPIGRTYGSNTQTTTYDAKPDEKKKFWNTGVTNQTDVSFASGDFYLSAQNVDIRGVLPKDQNKRQSIHLSSVKDYNKLKTSFSLNYTQSNYNVNAGSSFGNGRDYSPYWNLINTPAEIPLTKYKDWRNDYWSSPNHYYNDYYYNPYWTIDNFRQVGRSDDIFGNVEASYKFAPWLTATYRMGATVTNSNFKATQGAFVYSDESKASGKSNAVDLVGAVTDGTSFSSRINSEFFLQGGAKVGSFKIDGLLGQNYRETSTQSVSVSSSNLGIPSVYNVSVRKGEPGASEANSKTKLERFFGRATVTFNSWATLDVTGSYDIDSRLSNSYNYNLKDISFFYPGASLALVLSEVVPALKNSNKISFVKVRGSLSKTGNVNLGAYSLENTFSPGAGFPFGTTLGFTANDILRKDKYKPEFVKSKEAGIELGFFKNRINVEATAYQQDNTNQIITVAYSAATGYPNALLNAASFINKGLEFDLRLTPLVRIGAFNIDFKANYTHQSNKVTQLIEGVNELGTGNGNFIITGLPAYTFKLTDYLRDDQGRVIVDKQTGYPSIDPTVKVFGQTIPSDLLGLNLNVGWKGLSLSAVADYRTGNQVYSGLGPDMDFSGLSYRTGQNARQPFIFPNSVYNDGTGKYIVNTDIYTKSGGYNFWSQSINTSVNSNYLASGAFWKLRELAISYRLPNRLLPTKAIKGASISISGRNLVTWLPKTNEWTDPEFSNTTGNAQGVNDRNNTPPTRIFGANITLQF